MALQLVALHLVLSLEALSLVRIPLSLWSLHKLQPRHTLHHQIVWVITPQLCLLSSWCLLPLHSHPMAQCHLVPMLSSPLILLVPLMLSLGILIPELPTMSPMMQVRFPFLLQVKVLIMSQLVMDRTLLFLTQVKAYFLLLPTSFT